MQILEIALIDMMVTFLKIKRTNDVIATLYRYLNDVKIADSAKFFTKAHTHNSIERLHSFMVYGKGNFLNRGIRSDIGEMAQCDFLRF